MYLSIEEPTKKISKEAVKVWRLSNTIGHGIGILILGALLFVDFYFDWKFWIGWILIGVTGLTALSAMYSIFIEPFYLQKTWRYEVDTEHVQLKHGRIEQKHIIIPMSKIEFVSTHQGPLLRKYGLYNLGIGTVTSSHTIPAIPTEEALELRAKIARLAKVKDMDDVAGEEQ